MAKRIRKDLRLITYPYFFVLKEGAKIQSDPFDFSLLMLQVTCPEVLKSPSKKASKSTLAVEYPNC